MRPPARRPPISRTQVLAPCVGLTHAVLNCEVRPTTPRIAVVDIVAVRMPGVGSVSAIPRVIPAVIAMMMVSFADADVNAWGIDIEALGVCRPSTRQVESRRGGNQAEAEESFCKSAHVFLQCCSY